MYHKILPIIFLIFSQSAFSKIREFQTTRLKSTGGTGVASILMDEATVLNPAPLAFFNLTAVLVQTTGGNIETTYESDLNKVKADNYAAILSDAKSSIKGSVSYIKQKEGDDKRSIISVSTAFPIQQKSAIGITYRKIMDTIQTSPSSKIEESANQFVIGATHNLNTNFSIGAILIDPIPSSKNKNPLGVIGAQVVYGNFIALMLDVGADYKRPLDETLLYRGAVQFLVFSDVYIRAGYFNDRGLEEKGTGVGVGWVQPRLALEAALKNSKSFSSVSTGEKSVKETSFSLSYRF